MSRPGLDHDRAPSWFERHGARLAVALFAIPFGLALALRRVGLSDGEAELVQVAVGGAALLAVTAVIVAAQRRR